MIVELVMLRDCSIQEFYVLGSHREQSCEVHVQVVSLKRAFRYKAMGKYRIPQFLWGNG